MEGRLLLSVGSRAELFQLLRTPPGAHPQRPNTPVLPFGASTKTATFIDPSARIVHGAHIVVSQKTFIGAFVGLNATTGFIKIGINSDIRDNATIISNPSRIRSNPTSVFIGSSVVVGYGATILGPSTIGGYGAAAKGTEIGPNALIDGATIEPGAIVGALARVGPGVTVPSGFRVLPGANVTTNAEASDPALGKVVKVTPAELTIIKNELSNSAELAAGYTTLYQGNSATGANPGADSKTVFNGNLTTVEGASAEPGSPTVSFEPTKNLVPQFPGPKGNLLPSALFNFKGRIVGWVVINQQPVEAQALMGLRNSIRGDEGQPIKIGSIGHTGAGVTIAAAVDFKVTIGENFQAGDGAVILGGHTRSATLGNNVSVGSGAVVVGSTIGNGATIGSRAYVFDSTIPAGGSVPAGAIMIDNKIVGTIQW